MESDEKGRPEEAPTAGSADDLCPETVTVATLHEYTALLGPPRPNKIILYRGQAADWPLVPKIARLTPRGRNILATEEALLAEFKRRAPPYLRLSPYGLTDWNWLTIAQHHGLPTRLLDWTTASLTALLFAVGDFSPEQSGSGVVWCYTPDTKDGGDLIDQEYRRESPFDDAYYRTKVYMPQQVDIRPKTQDGAFTVHRHSIFAGGFVPFQSIREQIPKLKKIVIPRGAFPRLRAEVENAGMTFEKLFPDLDGLAKHLQWKHFILPDEVGTDDGTGERPPPAYPEGRADAPSGSPEAGTGRPLRDLLAPGGARHEQAA
jgi:hypothetical protein